MSSGQQLSDRTHKLLNKHFSGESVDYHQIISLTIPILIDQAFIILLNLINTAMISSSGVAAVSAVNMVDALNIFLVNVFVAVATGGTVVVAQYKGSRNDQMVSKAAAGAVSSVFLLSVFISLFVIVLHNPTLKLLFGSAEADVYNNARTYLIGSGLSFCGIAIVQAVSGVLRGIGKTRASLVLSLILNFTYVLLNFVLINVAHMGILGMTISVNIARYLGAACAIYYLVKMETSLHFRIRETLRVKWSMLKKIMFIGVPFAAEQLFFNGGKLLTQTFIVGLGTYAIATNAISASIAGVFQIPANALSITIVTVVGQCIGRNEIDDAKKFIRSFIWLASFSFVVMGILIMPFFYPLVSIFAPPAEIVDDIFWIVLINTLMSIPLWPISFITPSGLRAAGDAKFTSIVAMLSMWLFRVVLGYILGVVFPFGILGVWLAMDFEWGIRGAIFIKRYFGKKWYQHRLVE